MSSPEHPSALSQPAGPEPEPGPAARSARQKRREERLNHVQRLIMQGELGASAVHEISNLLTIVLFNAELLRERRKHEPEDGRYIEPILQAANHIAMLCAQLRNLARPQPADLHLVDLVETTRNTHRLLAQIISRELDFEVPAGSSVMVMADPAHIDQMLVNLVLNARDATPEEGGRIVVRVGFRPDERRPGGLAGCIEVEDNGTGMTAKVKRRLFKARFTTKPRGHGTGLGLVTVRRLMRGMSGDIDVESQSGQGTRMRLLFPLVNNPQDERPAVA